MVPSTLRPKKTAVLIAQQIVDDIQRRAVAPGELLPPERVMLEHYQIGRGTLRESLRYLEMQGLIVMKPGPGGGPVVQEPSGAGLASAISLLLQIGQAPYRTVIQARESLEPAMSELAALHMSDDALESLALNVRRTRAGLADIRAFMDLNLEFHDLIARSSGNALFRYMIDAMTDILDGTAMGVEYPEPRRAGICDAHERIYEAIRSREPIAAREAMREHLAEYSQYLTRKFPDVVQSPIRWG
jgi:GntR family transcriptional regulator, transcriptional repressor for pyruvate dehydrogenase complex